MFGSTMQSEQYQLRTMKKPRFMPQDGGGRAGLGVPGGDVMFGQLKQVSNANRYSEPKGGRFSSAQLSPKAMQNVRIGPKGQVLVNFETTLAKKLREQEDEQSKFLVSGNSALDKIRASAAAEKDPFGAHNKANLLGPKRDPSTGEYQQRTMIGSPHLEDEVNKIRQRRRDAAERKRKQS